ncbi:MAG: N-carbamoylputrescine amidase [Gammaproteobacteria bacterium]
MAGKTGGGGVVRVAVVQMACGGDINHNCDKAEKFVRDAAGAGADIVLLQELFSSLYFCPEQNGAHFDKARALGESEIVARFRQVALDTGAVLPVSFFERANNAHYNSAAVIDADGTILGVYRKSHIPDGPGYCEKFYFNPGDTGFRVWQTKAGVIGVGICWDQWFPEAARAMALMGADILLYPTAIGSEPQDASLDSSAHWLRVMQGHAGANLCAIAASNRTGMEEVGGVKMKFYGKSFITGAHGEMLAEMDDEEGFVMAELNLPDIRTRRRNWGIFRDRRPSLYKTLLTSDGGG